MPMSIRSVVLSVVVLLGGAAWAGDDIESTHGFTNGHAWQDGNTSWKLGYVEGFNDAHGMSLMIAHCKEGGEPLPRPSGITYGDLMHAVDQFYSNDATNIRIPIGLALIYEEERFQGKSDADLKTSLDSMRAASR